MPNEPLGDEKASNRDDDDDDDDDTKASWKFTSGRILLICWLRCDAPSASCLIGIR